MNGSRWLGDGVGKCGHKNAMGMSRAPLHGELVSEHGNKFPIRGLILRRTNPAPERPVQGLHSSAVPGHMKRYALREGRFAPEIEGYNGEKIAMRKKYLYRQMSETFVAISL